MTTASTVSYSRRSTGIEISETLGDEMVHNDYAVGMTSPTYSASSITRPAVRRRKPSMCVNATSWLLTTPCWRR